MKFTSFLTRHGFKTTNANHVVFTKDGIIIVIYADNSLLIRLDINQINRLKKKFSQTFKMINLGPCKYYLGMQITQDQSSGTIQLDQTEYIKRILQTFQMTSSKPIVTPMEQELQLPPLDQDSLDTKLRLQYQTAIGSLMYAMIKTRPDIA